MNFNHFHSTFSFTFLVLVQPGAEINTVDYCDNIIYATADEADAYMFHRCFFFFFSFFRSPQNTRQPFSGMAERIFMKLLPDDSGENVRSNVVPKWGLGPK